MKDSLNRVVEEPVEAPKSQSNEQIEETKPITRPQRKTSPDAQIEAVAG